MGPALYLILEAGTFFPRQLDEETEVQPKWLISGKAGI